MNEHVRPEIAARLHRYWLAPNNVRRDAACQDLGAALAPSALHDGAARMDRLRQELGRIRDAFLASEAAAQRKAAAARALQDNLRRALETAKHPPLPAHLSTKRHAQQMRDLLAYDGWWARQNRREQALREALRAHCAHQAQQVIEGAQPCHR